MQLKMLLSLYKIVYACIHHIFVSTVDNLRIRRCGWYQIFEIHWFTQNKRCLIHDAAHCPQAGKLRKMRHEQQKEVDGLGPNIRGVVVVGVVMMLLMFAVHCTWVTSNAYSSPSIVLASYSNDG